MEKHINFLTPLKSNNTCNAFIIAEAGVHHGCDIDAGKQLIDAAAAAGADAVKFQTYKAETLVTRWAPQYWESDGDAAETQFDCFAQRDKFDFADYAALAAHARRRGIHFCSTPFDLQAVRWLNDLDVPFWKVASGDIDNYILLAEIAKTGKPVLLSTGASYFSEIESSVAFLSSQGVQDLALLHCNLAYPTPDSEANLNRITALQARFPGTVIGYSDHTIPDREVTIPVAAAVLGAQVIEKHFTLDRALPEDDHYHAVDADLLAGMIQRIAQVEQATQPFVELTASELPARRNARRSLVAARTIAAGSVVTRDMIMPKRPGGGISPARVGEILGRTVRQTIPGDTQIRMDALEN